MRIEVETAAHLRIACPSRIGSQEVLERSEWELGEKVKGYFSSDLVGTECSLGKAP